MIPIKTYPDRHLGWTDADLARYAYGKFWQPMMKPLSAEAQNAVIQGAIAEPLLPSLEQAATQLFSEQASIENGYCLCADGAMHIAIRTDMPRVSPRMIDWWFGWHGSSPERYKLWHPQAHVHAQWLKPVNTRLRGRDLYIGQTSCVDEYVGGELGRFAIQFVHPETLGLTDVSLDDDQQATAICARVGLVDYPLDVGYLIHHVRRTATGSEMRSRFWIAGKYASPRNANLLTNTVVQGARHLLKPKHEDARGLLVHCAQEMAHLAAFLPELYQEFYEMD